MKEDSGTPGTAELSGGGCAVCLAAQAPSALSLVSLISLGMHIPPDSIYVGCAYSTTLQYPIATSHPTTA